MNCVVVSAWRHTLTSQWTGDTMCCCCCIRNRSSKQHRMWHYGYTTSQLGYRLLDSPDCGCSLLEVGKPHRQCSPPSSTASSVYWVCSPPYTAVSETPSWTPYRNCGAHHHHHNFPLCLLWDKIIRNSHIVRYNIVSIHRWSFNYKVTWNKVPIAFSLRWTELFYMAYQDKPVAFNES